MKKIFIILLLIFVLASCSDEVNQNFNPGVEKQDIASSKGQDNLENIEIENKIDPGVEKNNPFEAKVQGGTTNFLALNINSLNFKENNSKINNILKQSDLKKDKVQIVLQSSNHVYSYEDVDYLNNITLSDKKPIDYRIIETKMGGHHVIVILEFPLGTKIDELKFNNSPVGDISLVFNK